MLGELVRQVARAEKVLRASEAMAIQEADRPTDEAVARAAGWTVEHEQVELLRADLNAAPPDRVDSLA